ncbi:hypothetical protein RchiOBHm_Chr7g0191861 [Rosa chinensis]|uniref:Uncharacterized protein n=1 Tax=Rosa chinensis TaxID=74649 RepID=A0A2P6P5D7_ROSCH|nr:hypothetical protein RchiOBHm_Chr7g0191861 [Rosa chinensis]
MIFPHMETYRGAPQKGTKHVQYAGTKLLPCIWAIVEKCLMAATVSICHAIIHIGDKRRHLIMSKNLKLHQHHYPESKC